MTFNDKFIEMERVSMSTKEKNPRKATGSLEPIAIIGMSCIFPKAQSLPEYWHNIKTKIDAITEVPPTHWRPEDYFDPDPKRPDHTYAKTGGFLSPYDFAPSEFGISPSSVEAIDTAQLLSLVVAQGAMIDAGYTAKRPYNRDAVSVILGSTGTLELSIPLGARLGHPHWRKAMKQAGIADDVTAEIMDNIGDAYVSWQENSFPGLLGNVIAGRVANRLDLGGTNCVVDAACGSSFSAAHLGIMELQTGRAEMVISGGVDTFNHIFMYMCFSKTPALSATGHARPFSVDSDGTILGEGVGMMVFKRLSDAERDGDKIYAVIKSMGTSSDGKGKAIYAPSSEGQVKALKRAYEMAGVTPETVELVEAHGTGTKVGDVIEIDALKTVFTDSKRPRPWCAVGSVKSQIGHTKAAAGTAGLIKMAMALNHKIIPPTIKVSQPNPAILAGDNPFYIATQKQPWFPHPAHPRRGAVSAMGFGGSNYHLVVEEYQTDKKEIDWDEFVEIIAFSGQTPEDLKKRVREFSPASCSWNTFQRKAAASRRDFSEVHPFRLITVIDRNKPDFTATVEKAIETFSAHQDGEAWNTPDGIFLGRGPKAGGLGMLFPGQGAQYPGMLTDLVCTFPSVFSSVVTANEAFGYDEKHDRKLTDLIFPKPRFEEGAREGDEEALRATNIAQPAIGAVSAGAYKLLAEFGIKPEGTAGHSFGELTALFAAGVISESDFLHLAKIRGELMAKGTREKGTMVAVSCAADVIAGIIAEEKLDIIAANKNSPRQTVISGRIADIDKALKVLDARKIRYTVLQVAGAFHSPLVADAAEPFKKALQEFTFHAPEIPVYSNSTGGEYPKKPAKIKEILGNHLAQPVEFVTEIEAMYDAGIRTFVEVGPGARLGGMVKHILGTKPFTTLAIDASSGQKSGLIDLGRALAALASLGFSVKWSAWQNGEALLAKPEEPQKPKLTMPICGANYRAPTSPKPKRTVMSKPESAKPAATPAKSVSTLPVSAHTQPVSPVPPSAPTHQMAHAAQAVPLYSASAPVMSSQPTPLPIQAQAGTVIPSADTFRMAHQSLAVLQQLQAQTAELHRRFLEGQETAQKTIQELIHQQTAIFTGSAMSAPAPIQAQPRPTAYVAPAPHYTPGPPTAHIAVAPPVAPMASIPVAPAPVVAPKAAPVSQSPVSVPQTTAKAAPALDMNRVRETLLGVVSEKTGYPTEMINLDMDMEADLGIDSIKRVEILSAMQEKMPEAPVIKPEHLGKFRTLQQVVDFLAEGLPQAATAASASPSPASAAAGSGPGIAQVMATLLSVVSEKTGYPTEMINLDMDMEADLGIDSIKRVEILSAMQEKMPEAPVIKPEHLGKFRTLQQIVEFLGAEMPQLASTGAAPVTTGSTPSTGGPGNDEVSSVLLAVVSEKTGYPMEMLDLNMNMESDLGIDSIKRVEIMSAMQEKLPNAPVIQPSQLGQLQTLGQIIDFLSSTAGSSGSAGSAASGSAKPVATASPSHQATAQAPASGTSIDAGTAQKLLLEIVSDKTGYPAEMLNLDMDMEADLGIDSIKRVEILSAFQEKAPDAPVVQPGDLGKFRTLQQVITYLGSSGNASAASQTAITPASAEAAKSTATPDPIAAPETPLHRNVLQVVSIANPAQREKIALKKGGTIIITDDGTDLPEALAGKFKAQGLTVEIVAPDRFERTLPPENLSGIIIFTPPETGKAPQLWNTQAELFVKDAFFLGQKAGKAMRQGNRSDGRFLATVTRFDGGFGFLQPSDHDPIYGAMAGFTKTAAHEWPEISCKAIDLDPKFQDTKKVVESLYQEVTCRGPVEVGVTAQTRQTLQEVDTPLPDKISSTAFQPGDIMIVSGGARGVTAETAVALAAAFKPTLILVGRSTPPNPEPEWLEGLKNDGQIKKAILAHAGSGKMSPKQLEEEFRKAMANREILNNIARIEAAGSRVRYYSADIRDTNSIKAVIDQIRREFPDRKIRVLVHGAGVLRDRKIDDKTSEQLNEVFDTKISGLRALLENVRLDELRAVALFSSVTGRYGRIGQVDYAMANEALNKIGHKLSYQLPQCRIASINWGPWAGGMVTESLKKVFHAEGVELIPLASGAKQLVKEIAARPDHSVEAVVGGRFQKAFEEDLFNTGNKPLEPIAGGATTVAFERVLTPDANAFLYSHVINGEPVLPVAVIMEWLGHGALHANPGYAFHGIDNLRVQKGIILKSGQPFPIRVISTKAQGKGPEQTVVTEIRSGPATHEIIHARAEVVLTTRLPEAIPTERKLEGLRPYPCSTEAAYQDILFHGEVFHGIQRIEGWSPNGIVAQVKSAPAPQAWMKDPVRGTWVSDPLILDSAFQLMILWTHQQHGELNLPSFLRSYRQFSPGLAAGKVKAVIHAYPANGRIAKADIEFLDEKGRAVGTMQGFECIMMPTLNEAFKKRSLEMAHQG
jgi:acyl transferase domain-containing protein/NAD(P)-dependent dehydrogenase (short-subunit alcohol dehydrogenase family)